MTGFGNEEGGYRALPTTMSDGGTSGCLVQFLGEPDEEQSLTDTGQGLEDKLSEQISDAGLDVNYETDKITYTVPERQSTYTPDFSSTHQTVDFISRAKAGGRSMTDKALVNPGTAPRPRYQVRLQQRKRETLQRVELDLRTVVRQTWVSLCQQDNPTGMVTGRKANNMTVPDTQANFVRHERCENCGSSDANARYDDGHAFCFSCETYTPPEEGEEPSGSTSPTSQLQATDSSQQKTLLTGEIKAIPARRTNGRELPEVWV